MTRYRKTSARPSFSLSQPVSPSAVERGLTLGVKERARLNYAEQGMALADAHPNSFTMHHPEVMSLWTVPAVLGSILNCAVYHDNLLPYHVFVETAFKAFMSANARDAAVTVEITEPAPLKRFAVDQIMWETLEVFALAHGLRCVAELPVMVIDPRHFKLANDNSELFEGALRLEYGGFSPRGIPELPNAYLADRRVHVVSSKDGLGHGVLFVDSNDTGGIYWVHVAEDARGRGLGRAITKQLLLIAYQLGLRIVVLQSSRMGWPVYNRIGFREILRYRQYSLPGEMSV